MRWVLDPYSDLTNLEQKINARIADEIAGVQSTIENLQIAQSATPETSTTSSPNYLPNSHPEWSKMAWENAGITAGTAGDTNREAYNWYYIISTATEMLTTQPVLASGHASFAGLGSDVPIWDAVNGTFKLGGVTDNYYICCPLPTDFVFPGQKFYVYLEASVDQSDTDVDDAEIRVDFYDNTAGQRKIIEGGDFTPTATVIGVAGSRTIEYKVHARTDAGTEILSTAVTVTTAPSTLSTDNHIKLDFQGAPGFIQYTVYRKVGSNYYRVGDIRNSIDLQFFDLVESGSTVVPVTGYPSVTGNKPKALAQTNNFTPASPGSFNPHTLLIQVPLTYNRSNTGNLQQWFRIGLSSLVASGSAREVVIRRIHVSEGYGTWTRSQLDLQALSGPTSTATSGPSPGSVPIDPPPPGGGGYCLTLDTLVDTKDGQVVLEDIEPGDYVTYDGKEYRVKRVGEGTVQCVWEIETDNGSIVRASDDHRWPTPKRNRCTRLLKVGDVLLDRTLQETKIVRKDKIYPTEYEALKFGGVPVKRIWIAKPNRFVANGLVTLNRKDDGGDLVN